MKVIKWFVPKKIVQDKWAIFDLTMAHLITLDWL